jgi:hypothetical protein
MKVVKLTQIRDDLIARGAAFRRYDKLYPGSFAPFKSGQEMVQWSQCRGAVEKGLRKLLRHFDVNPTERNLKLCARGVELLSAMQSIHCEELKRDASEWLHSTENHLQETRTLTAKKYQFPSTNAVAALAVRWSSQTIADDNCDVQTVLASAFAMGFEAGIRCAAAACSSGNRNLTEGEVLEPLSGDWTAWQGFIRKAQELPAGTQISTLTKTW